MIEELKAYSDFKATGLPWLERIPSHWNLVPNRALVRRRKQLVGRNHHRYRLLSLTKQGVIVRDVASGKGKFSSDMGTSQEVRDGDLVFCFFDVPETPRTVGLSPHHGMITGAYTVLEPLRPGVASYFELFYRAMDDSKLLSPLYSGLRNTIPVDRFLGTKTPLPPPEEQEAIVRFLDHANRRIDQFIRSKTKLIALLNEQKQAIIHRAVTRGLAASVKMRDSGVLWLGEVPAHWQVLPVGRAARVSSGKFLPSERVSDEANDRNRIPVVGSNGEIGYTSSANSTCPVVVVGRVGSCGAVNVVSGAAWITDNALRVTPLAGVTLRYLAETLRLADLAHLSTGSAQPLISGGAVRAQAMPLPPTEEQEAIAEFVAREGASVDAGVAQANRQLGFIREYRTRLVADVVTGQLDVRTAAAGLPVVETEAALTKAEADETDIEDGEAA